MEGDPVSKKKKKRLKRRKPPLSPLDKALYGVWFLFHFCVLAGLLILLTVALPRIVAFHDAQVVAYHSSMMTMWLVAPLALYLFVTVFLVAMYPYAAQIPIFGNRKVEYGRDPWDLRCFPLTDRRHWQRPPKKYRWSTGRIVVCLAGLWLAGLLLLGAVALPSVIGRDCLRRDATVVCYNGQNKEVAVYQPDTLTVRAYFQRGRYGGWRCALILQDENRRFSFTPGDFRRTGSPEDWLQQMLEVKSHVPPEKITIEGRENLGNLQGQYGLNAKETSLLRQLFTVD